MRRMRDYPREFVIRGNTWRVKWRRKLYDPAHGWCDGLCDHDARLIEIRMGLTPAERAATFQHELLHALASEYGFRLAHPTIANLERPLAEFFAQNAWIQWAEWFEG